MQVVDDDVISVLSLGPLLPVYQGTLTCIAVHFASGTIKHKDIPIHVRGAGNMVVIATCIIVAVCMWHWCNYGYNSFALCDCVYSIN